MQKSLSLSKIEWIEASLLTQTSIEGGSRDKETTDDAVMACLVSSNCEEMTCTVEVIPRIELRKSFFKSEFFIRCAR